MSMKFLGPEQYQKIACEVFDKLSAKINVLIPQSSVEHIGSSSVPGIISKGDLDIFVGVQKDAFGSAIKLIESLNFSIKKNTLRTDSLCMFESDQYSIDVAIQLVEIGSKFENFLIFRDSLLKNKNLRIEYNQLKKDAEELDANEYRKIKSQFIEKVLASKN